MITISYSYKVPGKMGVDEKLDNKLRDLAEKNNGNCPNSGSGDGMRDLEFEFGEVSDAKVFREEAKKIVGDKGIFYVLVVPLFMGQLRFAEYVGRESTECSPIGKWTGNIVHYKGEKHERR